MKKPLVTMVLAVLTVTAGGADVARQDEPEVGSEGALSAQQAAAEQAVDRIVAVVDEDPILASDLDRAIGLGLVSRAEDESETAFRRRVLDRMLEERLRAHEVDRFGFTEISLSEVEKSLAALKRRFPSDEAFLSRLEDLDLDLDDARQIVARQVMVLTYVDERLGPRVFVSVDDIRAYYDEVLTPEMKRRGSALPELASVREMIRGVLREQRLNQEIERWTDELRLEADIEDYFELRGEPAADALIGVLSASESGP